MRTRRRLTAALLTGLAGCGATADETRVAGSGTDGHVADAYLCSDIRVTGRALVERQPLEALGHTAEVALAEAIFDDGRRLAIEEDPAWFVVAESSEELSILREAEPSDAGDLPAGDHEVVTVSRNDETDTPPGWFVSRQGRCMLTVDLGDLTVPEVVTDSSSPPDPSSRQLHLLVTEQGCSSGEDAEGRIEVVDLAQGADRVRLVLGVRPREGGQTCPNHPATPFTVTLSEPLGDRAVVDGALAIPRELVGATG